MAKRKIKKNYLVDKVHDVETRLNFLIDRVRSIEYVVDKFFEMKKLHKKLEKYMEKDKNDKSKRARNTKV